MTQSDGNSISKADIFDLELLMGVGKLYHDEVMTGYEYDEDALRTNLEAMLLNETVHIFMAKRGNKLIGLIGFALITPISGGPLTATELFWYILKEHRNSRAAIALVLHAHKYLENKGVGAIEMTAMESSMPDKVESILVRLGYQPSERHFRKILKETQQDLFT